MAQHDKPLRRILGAPTALFIGMGVAIGSGIFRTPGIIAHSLHSPMLIVLAWVFGGVFVLLAGLVTAELATRFSQAGGEYVFLREAYGEFVAFFFGWAYTVFIIGGGAASIAAAFGDFGCQLLALETGWSRWLAAGAIVLVTGVNCVGLRAGAGTQNVLTFLKVAALVGLFVVGMSRGDTSVDFGPPNDEGFGLGSLGVFVAAVIPVLWAYDGTTDAVKMAEEIKDARRALPRALIGSALLLTLLYVGVNVALMRILPVDAMTRVDRVTGQVVAVASVPGEAMGRVFGPGGARAMLAVAMLVCLGSLSSTVLATIRVTFALARDGLTFRFMARMSKDQAPIPAFIVVAVFAVVLVLTRKFERMLDIYFFASAILFGLSYASLIVFRLRERAFPADAFRCPAGPVIAILLIAFQIGLATSIIYHNPGDGLTTAGLLAVMAGLYFVWKRVAQIRAS